MPSALVIDSGLFPDVARHLSKAYDVRYFSSWANAFPKAREQAVALGIPGIERVNEPIREMLTKPPDLVVVPDLYLNDYEMAARKLGIPTIGAGDANQLETDRWHLKEFLVEHDLDVIKSVEIEGIDYVKDYVEKNPETFVKVSVFRGDMETRSARDWLTEYNDLRSRLGPLGQKMRFIVEDAIPDAREIGVDCWWCDGEIVEPFLVGAETKDARYWGYVCDSVKKLPKETQRIVKALGEYFRQYEYRGFFSNEMRILPSGQTFFTDATTRVPSPPGGVMMAACKNFPKMLAALAKGESIAPEFDGDWLFEFVFRSEWVLRHYLEVEVPSLDGYTFHNYCMVDDKVWIIPHDSEMREFGSALGWGGLEDGFDMAMENCENAHANRMDCDKGTIESVKEEIAKAGKLGFTF
jgi:hypothetical protein